MSKSDFFLNPILVKITCKIPRTESSKLHLLRNCCDARQLLFKMITWQTIVWIKISWPLSFQSLKCFLIRDIFVKEDFTNQPQFLKSILHTWTHRLQKRDYSKWMLNVYELHEETLQDLWRKSTILLERGWNII